MQDQQGNSFLRFLSLLHLIMWLFSFLISSFRFFLLYWLSTSFSGLTIWLIHDFFFFFFKQWLLFILCFRIHPRDKQDVAYRLTLGARAVAYNEQDVPFLGPFPKLILSTQVYINIAYDQTVSVTPSKDIFEVRPFSHCELCPIWTHW